MKTSILLTIALLILSAGTHAPTEPYFALNHETKQCAGFWGGDEYVTYELPSGWTIYEFELEQSRDGSIFEVETDIGTCRVPWEGQVVSETLCCAQLGYTYLDENIGIRVTPSDNRAAQEAQHEALRSIERSNLMELLDIVLIALVSISIILAGAWIVSAKIK